MISPGLRVKVHYRGTLADGTEFDNSRTRGKPLEFVMGTRAVLPAFEQAVSSLSEGTNCRISIPAVDAYGFYHDDLVDVIPKDAVARADKLPTGSYVFLRGDGGKPVRAKVLEVDETSVRLDYNHPLAGKDLSFEIELLEVERKPAIEQEKHPSLCDCHRVRNRLGGRHDDHGACCSAHASHT